MLDRGSRDSPFGPEPAVCHGGRYESEDEAQNACAGMGRRIIDGGVPGWSVDHLRVPAPGRRTFVEVWRDESMRVFLCTGLFILALSVYVFLRIARD